MKLTIHNFAYQFIPWLKSFMFWEKKKSWVSTYRDEWLRCELKTSTLRFSMLWARKKRFQSQSLHTFFSHHTHKCLLIDPWIEIFVQTRNCALKMCVLQKRLTFDPYQLLIVEKRNPPFLFLRMKKKNWRISALEKNFKNGIV